METSSTISHQFGVPVDSDVKPGLIVWPHSPEHASAGIVTMSFNTGDLD